MPDSFFAKFSEDARSAGLPFVIVGGHAVNAYGYQRTTLDADFLIPETTLAAWRTFWESRGYACVHTSNAFCQFRSSDGAERFPVDLMLVDDATFATMHARHQDRDVGGTQLAVPDPLDLIALKLHALRSAARARDGRDILDVLGLVRGCRIDTKSVEFNQLLDRYADEATRQKIRRALSTD
ncbi:MAG: hypothetical protein O3B24_05160 [Verrucomicrobia bacterium]|nr:hypothetical protein [Verrucomicrobiota bacterium]